MEKLRLCHINSVEERREGRKEGTAERNGTQLLVHVASQVSGVAKSLVLAGHLLYT